jgi:hypothetical protein
VIPMASDHTDKLKVLEEKVRGLDDKNADGNLMIKVSKRDTALPSGIYRSQIVCTLSGAAISHVANPELWLPALMGGGEFLLSVHAAGQSSVALVEGIPVTLIGDERRLPDLDVTSDPSWKGPKTIIYPSKKAIPPTPTVIASPPNMNTSLPGTAPQTPSQFSGGSGGTHHDAELRRMIEEQRAYAQQLQQQLQESNRLRDEERHKREMEALKLRQESEMERQRQETERIRREVEAMKNAPPPQRGPSIAETLKELVPVLMPAITAYMGASAERERRAEERQAEILKAMQSRPAIDPVLKEILDQKAANELPVMTVLQQSAQANAAMMSQMMDMAQRYAEATAGPEENPVVKIAREVGSALRDIATPVVPAPRPRRLPRTEVVENDQVPPAASPAPAHNAAMHGLEGAPAAKLPPRPKILGRLKAMLIAHEDPEKVASETFKAYNTEEFQDALEEAGGDPVVLFQELLGNAWIEANIEYVNSFGQAFTRKMQVAASATTQEEEAEEEAA